MIRPAAGCFVLPFALTLFACSSDEKGGPALGTGGFPTGGVPGTGGSPPAGGSGGVATGGAPATGGLTASGGAGGVASGGATGTGGVPGADLYVCEKRAPRDPGGTGTAGSACCGGKGSCVAPPATPNPALGHDTCGATLLCQPTDAALGAAGAFAKCTTKIGIKDPAGAEGRCVPKCFTLGNEQAVILDNGGTCGAEEVCMPCFSPVDGLSTGACTLKPADAPTTPAPTPYETCPGANDAGVPQGGGLCVPETALTGLTNQAHPYYNPSIPNLKKGTCDTGEKCVPVQKAKDPGHCFVKCTTSQFTQSVGVLPDYKFGACSPKYVIFDVAGDTGIQVSTGGGPCPDSDLCAPCMDPLNNGNPSGACY